MPTLTITPDSAFSIVLKARQFDAKVEETDPDSGSNPTDDSSVDALEFGADDDTLHALNSATPKGPDRQKCAGCVMAGVARTWSLMAQPSPRSN
jgi:hypothetical protein